MLLEHSSVHLAHMFGRALVRVLRSSCVSLCALALGLLSSCAGGGGGGSGASGSSTIPDAPANVGASVTVGEVRITWNAVPGAASYNLYQASEPGVDASNWSTLPDGGRVLGAISPQRQTGLTNNGTYYFVVTALNALGESPASAEVSATAMELPSAPVGVTARADSGQVTLQWNPVAGASSYRLYRANESGVTAENFASLQGGMRTDGVVSPQVVSGLANLTNYFFVVAALNPVGEGLGSLQIAATPLAPGWTSQVPNPTVNDLNRVEFVDADLGWIAGSTGTILHTTNGGSTWNAQWSGTNSRLSDIAFVDSSSGWIVGGAGTFGLMYGTILHTTNGGLDWTLQASGAVSSLNGVSFVDSANGWIVGDEGTILHTADGGTTWTRQTSPTSEYLWKVAFVDSLKGWIAGGNGNTGIILKTIDGGAHWTSQSINQAELYDLSFPTATRGWMADAGTQGRIFGTNNGGASWGQLPVPTSVSFRGIHFADTSTGWSVGNFGTILHTTNGGGSWNVQGSGTGSHLCAVESIGTQEAWAVGMNGVILHTSDGGATWQPQYQPGWLDGTPMTSASFVDADQGWIARRSILHTTDGGAHWTVQLASTVDQLWGLDFVDAQNGWAVGNSSQILHTSNGGASWVPQNSSGAPQLWGVDFVDADFGIAVGPMGVIRTTTDGGLNWIPRVSGTFAHFGGVCVVDHTTAWAVATGGMILKTTDGGVSWIGQLSGTTADLRAVHAVDASRAWAVGGNSSDPPIVRTTDGGEHWVLQQIPLSPGYGWFYDVTFSDADHGWAVGSEGLVCGTSDGGLSWQRQNSATSVNLWAVCAASSTTVWAVGMGLLKTTSGGW